MLRLVPPPTFLILLIAIALLIPEETTAETIHVPGDCPTMGSPTPSSPPHRIGNPRHPIAVMIGVARDLLACRLDGRSSIRTKNGDLP
jgi:hypothetical protein